MIQFKGVDAGSPVSAPFLIWSRNMKSSRLIMKSAGLVLLIAGTSGPSFADKNSQDASSNPRTQAVAYAQPAKAPVASAPAPIPAPAKIQMPPPEAMIIMIRSSLVALSQANVTNNYEVLNALGSNGFRQNNSPARLAELFAPFRTNNIDLAPVVFVTPQLSQQPTIADGKLRLVGYFPTQPLRVDYDLQFEPADGIWKIYGLSVNLNKAPPSPVQTPQTQYRAGQGAQPQSR
jgi:hypothetical protein